VAKKRKVRAATKHARAKKIGLMLLGGYDVQLIRQRGGCAICGQTPKVRRLNVDHSHDENGAVRGLLCHRCNRGLAFFGDRPERLEGAALYLKWGWAAAASYRDAYARVKA
jgi:hypothetical protein